MSKDNSRLWKAARRNVPGLPDCPQTVSEPRFAAYMFDQYCFVSKRWSFYRYPTSLLTVVSQACGRERSSSVDYALALRLCSDCYKYKYEPHLLS